MFASVGKLFVCGVLGERSLKSSVYIRKARFIWRTLFMHVVRRAFALLLLIAGKSRAARMAMTAITTSNSTNVNPGWERARIGMRLDKMRHGKSRVLILECQPDKRAGPRC